MRRPLQGLVDQRRTVLADTRRNAQNDLFVADRQYGFAAPGTGWLILRERSSSMIA